MRTKCNPTKLPVSYTNMLKDALKEEIKKRYQIINIRFWFHECPRFHDDIVKFYVRLVVEPSGEMMHLRMRVRYLEENFVERVMRWINFAMGRASKASLNGGDHFESFLNNYGDCWIATIHSVNRTGSRIFDSLLGFDERCEFRPRLLTD